VQSVRFIGLFESEIMIVSIRRILFPTDFSEPAAEAKNYALVLADRLGAELHLLHVVVPPGMPFPNADTSWTMPATGVKGLVKDAEQRLSEEIGTWAEARRAVSSVVTGFAVDEIVHYAEEQQIDLIVVGTHGLTGITHLLLGSVAEKLVRCAPCPVLTVHPTGHQFVLESAILAEPIST
jgi:nucleotide-binding universal stress UspA family protein